MSDTSLLQAMLAAKAVSGGGGGGNIASSNVTAMTGYAKAETAADISTSDTLNVAMGKLEKGVSDNTTNLSIKDITTSFVIEEGYALKTGLSKVYKQGNHVFGKLVVAIITGTLPTSQTKILTNSTYKPPVSYVTGCFCGTTEWKVNNIGYVYMSPTTGELSIYDSDNSNSDTVVNISLDYVTA